MGQPVIHFEIGCRDLAKTEKFYQDLFGWKTQNFAPAAFIETEGGKGIQGHMTALGHEPHNYTIFYVEVDDVAAYLEKVIALGGKKLVGPIPIPTGKFAWIQDLEGNTVGLLEPKK